MKIVSWIVFFVVMVGVLLFFRAMISDLNRMRKKKLRPKQVNGKTGEKRKKRNHLKVIK